MRLLILRKPVNNAMRVRLSSLYPLYLILCSAALAPASFPIRKQAFGFAF
jgi:hypothetical protein